MLITVWILEFCDKSPVGHRGYQSNLKQVDESFKVVQVYRFFFAFFFCGRIFSILVFYFPKGKPAFCDCKFDIVFFCWRFSFEECGNV